MPKIKKIKLLDLCCKAGGCTVGYYQASQELGYDIEITGIDIEPQPNYPYNFIQTDAVAYLKKNYKKYTHIHASPPCQLYSNSTAVAKARNPEKEYSNILVEIQEFLHKIYTPSVIENVLQAPIRKDIVLNGDMFKLKVIRSRKFELNNWFMMQPFKPKRFKIEGNNIMEVWSNAMNIHWMKTREELAESIPPAYTKYIGINFFNN
ncbi:hypothetical protein [Flavobacterium sp.]|uniref:hypothetical protein n=1 Tax=Flavobacterium sp. TaxID=239 RepID=UPI003751457A